VPLIFLLPTIAGALGFGSGYWVGDNFGWMKWLIIAAVIVFTLLKVGVIG